MSQTEFGAEIGISQSMLSKYEWGGQAIPDDVMENIIGFTKSVMLIQHYAFEKKAAAFNIPPLDNIDTHIMTVLHVFEKEALDAANAAHEMSDICANKMSKHDFNNIEHSQMISCIMRMVDLYQALNSLAYSVKETYDVNLDQISEALTKKYIDKSYICRSEVAE